MTKTSTPARVTKGVPSGGEFTATGHSDNVPSLTAPKVSSRGRTTNVTLPDGAVATRTSKTKVYSHAVILSPEIPEHVIESCERSIKRAQEFIAEREEALKDPKFAKKQRFPGDRDPDVDYRGEPVYYGFEYFLKSADGKERLETIRGNSQGISDGTYDPDTLEYISGRKERAVHALKDLTRAHIRDRHEDIATAQARIEAVKNGTYDLGRYGAVSWSSRADLAVKAANAFSSSTRRVSVISVDQ